MSLTTQYLQTGVHRHPPSLGLTMKITQQDSGRPRFVRTAAYIVQEIASLAIHESL